MPIGNIVSKNGGHFNDSLFNTSNDVNISKNGLPTIIIGWELTKELLSQTYKLSILEKKVDANLYWTFSKTEKRVDYDKDISFFIKICLKNTEEHTNYQYINLLIERYNCIKKILKILSSKKQLNIYIKNNSFIYIAKDDDVYGIDMNTIDYLGIDRKKIYKRLYNNNNEITFSDKFLDKEVRENINNNKIIPMLYKNNGKKD